MQTLAEEWMQEGKQLGRQQGRQEEAATFTLRLLRKHLGPLEAALEERIRALGLAQLEELGLAASDFRTKKEVLAWLRAHAQAQQA